MRTCTAALAALSIVIVATPAAARQAPSARAQLVEADRSLSDAGASGGFAAAIAGALTEHGAYLHPGAPVLVGPAPVRAVLDRVPGLADLAIQWQALHLEIAAESAFAISYGVTTARPLAGGAARFGKYLAAWERTGGTWRLAAIAFVGALPLLPEDVVATLPAEQPAAIGHGPSASVAAADLAFAALAGRSGAEVAFSRYAAADAALLGSGLLTIGPAAIRRAFAGNTATWRWHPVVAGAAAGGGLGFTAGEAEIESPGEGGTRDIYRTKYLTLWRRERGAWRFVADGGSDRPPPSATMR